jgi:glycerol-3-phosphate cytidylyltransferase
MKKKIVGFYPMVADVLHAGHILALKEAKANCDYLIVGLHCCPNYKKPVQTIFERFIQLQAVKYVDEVIPYTDINDSASIIKSLNYDIYFCGEDHKDKDFENKQVLIDLGKQIYYLSRKHNFSSTNLKERLK